MAQLRGLPWVQVATDLLDHPKVKALEHRLGDTRAGFYLVAVWMYLGRFYIDGVLPHDDDTIRAIESAARWSGAPGELCAALSDLGFLERRGKKLRAHNWERWSGSYSEKLSRDRAAKRTKRAELRKKSRATSRDVVPQKEKEIEKEKESENDAANAEGGGDWQQIEEVCQKLGSAFGNQMDIGRDREKVRVTFGRFLQHLGVDGVASECERIAREQGVTPGSLSWWIGWLRQTPTPRLVAARDAQAAEATKAAG